MSYHDDDKNIQTTNEHRDVIDLARLLQESEDRYSFVIEQSPIAIEIYDASGELTHVNSSCLKLFGIKSNKDVKGFRLFDDPNISSDHKRALQSSESIRYESIFDFNIIKQKKLYRTSKTGQVWLDVLITPTVDDKKRVIGYLIYIQDITTRKKEESELVEREQRFRSYFNISSHGIAITSPEKGWIEVNDKVCTLLGYKREEIIKTTWDELTHPDDIEADVKKFKKILSGEIDSYSLEKRFIRKDNSIIWTEIFITCNRLDGGKLDYTIAIIEDITDRKKIQDELQTRDSILAETLQVSTELIDLKTDSIDFEKITNTILHISGAKYASFNLFDENGLDFSTVALSGINENIMKVSSLLGFQIINKKWDYDPVRAEKIKDKIISKFEKLSDLTGDTIPKHISSLIEKTFDIGMVCIVKISKNDKSVGDFTLLFSKDESIRNTEIVELFANQVGLLIFRTKTEIKLLENESKTQAIVSSSQDAIVMMDDNANVVSWNQSASNLFGYEETEVIGKNLHHLIVAKKEHEDDTNINKFTHTGESAVLGKIIELPAKTKTGKIIEIELSISKVKLNNKWHAVGVMRDVTEKMKQESLIADKIAELEKLNSVMTGRELKMIELKEEIAKLRSNE